MKIRKKTLVGAQMYGLLLGGSYDYFTPSNPNPIENLFGSATPSGSIDTIETNLTLGTKVRFSVAGKVLGFRFWKADSANVGYTGKFYDNLGNLLASVPIPATTSSGWMEFNFASPIDVLANTIYVAAYYLPNGHYLGLNNFFTNAVINGNVEGIDTDESANGVFDSGDVFPTSTFNASAYYADVMFQENA